MPFFRSCSIACTRSLLSYSFNLLQLLKLAPIINKTKRKTCLSFSRSFFLLIDSSLPSSGPVFFLSFSIPLPTSSSRFKRRRVKKNLFFQPSPSFSSCYLATHTHTDTPRCLFLPSCSLSLSSRERKRERRISMERATSISLLFLSDTQRFLLQLPCIERVKTKSSFQREVALSLLVVRVRERASIAFLLSPVCSSVLSFFSC